jgi:HEAT repeat protein
MTTGIESRSFEDTAKMCQAGQEVSMERSVTGKNRIGAPAALRWIGAAAAAVLCVLGGMRVYAMQKTVSEQPKYAEEARAILREGFDSKDFQVRIEAITATGMIGQNEALIARVGACLQDKNAEVRLAAVHTLGDVKNRQSEELLRKTLEQDRVPEVSFAAAKVLATWQDSEGIDALYDVFAHQRKTRSNLILTEERSVVGEFHSAPSAMMFIIEKGVGYVPVPGAGEGFAALTMLVKDPGLSDRAGVVLILARQKNSGSLELLRRALADKDWSVRAAAAQMIARTARMELRDALVPLFTDKNRKVRFQAAGAYLHLLQVAKS